VLWEETALLEAIRPKQEVAMVYDSKPWLKSYDPGVDAEIEIPDISLKDALVSAFEEHADGAAIQYMGMTMGFGELLEQSGRLARALTDHGLGKGDVVAINMPNFPQYLVAIAGALRAGCATSGLSPLLTPGEMVYQLNDCGAKALVIMDMLFDAKYASVAEQTPDVDLVLVAGATDCLPQVSEYPAGRPLEGKVVRAFVDFVQEHPNEPPEVECGEEDICYVQYTGGTTGPPKGALLTNGNLVANIYQFEQWVKPERGREVFLTGFPMFHQAGLYLATCMMTWGCKQVLIPDPRNLEYIIGEWKANPPTYVGNVPSLALMLLGEEAFRALEFSQLKAWASGAAPFPVEAVKSLETVIGEGKMVEVWGMTETSPLITVNPYLGKKKVGSVGLPFPSTRLRVVDLNDGETQVPLGEEGELICSGPQVMKGYLNKPEETSNALREHDGAIWMHTGDVGRMDEDGYVYIVDRAKDMIIVGGYKVFSSEVEDKLFKHPAIGMCALIGLPNPDRPDSEIVKLVVQKSDEYQGKSDEEVEAELRAFSKENLAAYKVPKVYEFIEAIPLTSVGKVDKKAMRPKKR
jgi:acyl-CoA synthetase (AMP-forming)/AMP-acid ligase II